MKDQLTKEQFVERFVAEMLRIAGPQFDDGDDIEDYARRTAPTYWENEDQREVGPEECAQSDISYWEH